MKRSIGKIRGGIFMLTLMAGSFFAACTLEKDQYMNSQDEDAWVTLTLSTPQASLPKSVSRAQTDAETHVTSVSILVFKESVSGYEFSYRVTGTEITQTGNQQTQFKARLIATDTPLKLEIVLNEKTAFTTYTPMSGTSESVVRKQIKLPFSSAGMAGDLPMFGELSLPNGLQAGNNSFTVTVLRSIARVDVVKDLEPGSEEFILEEVYVFRANDGMQLIPDGLVASSITPKVDTPSIPDDAAFLSDPIWKGAPVGGADTIKQLYIPESKTVAESERVKGATVVVVGGRFGSDTRTTYYRVDFDSGVDGHPFGQVLRNHRYIFNIKKVMASGWDNPKDAAENFSTSILVKLQTWEDFSSDMYFGVDRFAVSSRDISLRFVKNREKRIDVESSLPYSIQWLDANGDPVGDKTSEQGVVISNGNFDVKIVKDGGDPSQVSHLQFRTLNNNHTGNIISDKLRIVVGIWSVDITVRQDNTAMYAGRHFNVLSGDNVGNLGTMANQTSASARAMRMILDNNFIPGRTIGIGGFNFGELSNASFNVTSATNLANLRRIFWTQNVVFLTYSIVLTNDVADMLLEWLDGDPKRVLIVGLDSDGTNANLRNKLTADGTWTFNIPSSIATYFIRANASAATDDFFNGPFGTVPAGTSFAKADNIAGYTLNPNLETVIPLIMCNVNTDAMVLGINKERRIIYMGDVQLFQTNSLSNDNGNVVTGSDIFMSNLWAWIVEQLIYGNK